MPWANVKPMDAKIHFLSDWLRGIDTFAGICRHHGISRKTGYKWIRRFKKLGPEGLNDQCRRPNGNPNRIPFPVRQALIDLRKQHCHWGPKKLLSLLADQHPDWQLPGKTTVYNILRTEGLIRSRRRRAKVAPSPKPFAPAKHPNDVWSADFKGQFYTKDGRCCYPLTVMDHVSRYLLSCQIVDGTGTKQSRRVFTALFKRYGLPERIRTDNGTPFASIGVGGLSKLSLWWIRLGILPERIEPGKPQQNGRHERMHRTLKDEALEQLQDNARAQQKRLDQFVEEYNELRPHESLKQRPPASCYRPSDKKMPTRLPPMRYPPYFKSAKVNQNGTIWINGDYIYIGYLLQGEQVGLEQIGHDLWEVFFGNVRLCRISKGQRKPLATLGEL